MAQTRFIPEQLTLEGMGEEILHHHGVPMGMLPWRRTIFKAHGGEFEYNTTVFCEDFDSVLWAAGKQILD